MYTQNNDLTTIATQTMKELNTLTTINILETQNCVDSIFCGIGMQALSLQRKRLKDKPYWHLINDLMETNISIKALVNDFIRLSQDPTNQKPKF